MCDWFNKIFEVNWGWKEMINFCTSKIWQDINDETLIWRVCMYVICFDKMLQWIWYDIEHYVEIYSNTVKIFILVYLRT